MVRFSEVMAVGKEHPISNSKWSHIKYVSYVTRSTCTVLCVNTIFSFLIYFESHNADDIFTIVFTSGSTGQPKGCVFSRGTWYQRMARVSMQDVVDVL